MAYCGEEAGVRFETYSGFGVARGIASAEAKPCINTRKKYADARNSIARKGQGRNSLAGCRGSAPAGVQRQSFW